MKLAIAEKETEALRRFIGGERSWSSSVIARVEVLRAIRAHGGPLQIASARATLARIEFIRLDQGLLDAAADLDAPLRTLDAIHLASARTLGDDLEALVTYDRALLEAALASGLQAVAPGR